jgi:Pyruvate/2-oxoacid:ferredoxin oxidoreductase gamma subunit
MKMKNYILLGALAISAVVGFEGCRKKEDTIAKIYVRDADMLLVSGAQVVLYGTSTINQPSNVVLYDTTVTNSAGEAIFNLNEVYQLGQAGVAVLNIDATFDGKSGQGIIKVEQETTSEETVFIQ